MISVENIKCLRGLLRVFYKDFEGGTWVSPTKLFSN